MPSRAKGLQEPVSEPEEENLSDVEVASSQGSSYDEESEQTVGDSRALVEIVKCSLEREKPGGWATTPGSTFRTGVAKWEHKEGETREGLEKGASERSWRFATVTPGKGEGYRAREGGC